MASPGALTTHVLDTAGGTPAAGLRIELYRIDGGRRSRLLEVVTDADGRSPGPLLSEGDLTPGTYELVFHVGAYFAARGVNLDDPRFLDDVPVRFAVGDAARGYHVPLLVAPYGYSTYRGS